jgi:hypothetical protein
MDLSNYVDVPTRFAMALERWPELRLVENRPEIITIGDKVFYRCHSSSLAHT